MGNQTTGKFLIVYQDVNYDDSFSPELVNELTQSHVEHVRDLDMRGLLFLCGPLKGDEKGIFILNAGSYEEVERYVLADPFIANKCYKSYVIHEIEEANASNNYLLDQCEM